MRNPGVVVGTAVDSVECAAEAAAVAAVEVAAVAAIEAAEESVRTSETSLVGSTEKIIALGDPVQESARWEALVAVHQSEPWSDPRVGSTPL